MLECAFRELHTYRATRYNFSTQPDDLRTGIREVVNSFIKPWGSQGFQVIDPSVVDLLNAVTRNAPENVVDMIASAASFDQIDQLWTLTKADSSGAISSALKREAERIAPSISRLANMDRRVAMKGGTAYLGPSYERRLATVVEMAQRLEAPAISALIMHVYARLNVEWQTERPEINDAVELIRVLDATASSTTLEMGFVREAVLAAALEEARTGCRADDLRELLSVIDAEQAEIEIAIARESFETYQQRYFSEDLRECRSREQFSGLIEDLELFHDELGVDVQAMIERVEQANADFEDNDDQYSDHLQDEWKERYRDERSTDRSISDMFGSLRGDRS